MLFQVVGRLAIHIAQFKVDVLFPIEKNLCWEPHFIGDFHKNRGGEPAWFSELVGEVCSVIDEEASADPGCVAARDGFRPFACRDQLGADSCVNEYVASIGVGWEIGICGIRK